MAGAAAAGAVGVTALAASPAAAAGVMQVDFVNTGSATTELSSTVAGVAALFGTNTSGTAGSIGVLGAASGTGTGTQGSADTGNGVFGSANGAGVGVLASSAGGTALKVLAPTATAGSHMLLQPHSTIVGSPTADPHVVGELWVDANADLFQCVGGATPGSWAKVGLIGRATDGDAMSIGEFNQCQSQTVLVTNVDGTGFVVSNQFSGAIGIKAESTTGAGIGLLGVCNTGYGLVASGGVAPLQLEPSADAGAPTTGPHQRGELYVDNAGSLYLCTVSNTPGTWTKLNGQFGGTGGLTPLAAPFRVYDSRIGQPNPSGSPQGKLAFNATARTIDCSMPVPAGATMILFNLTVSGTLRSKGALLVWPAGVPQPNASSINWTTAGTNLANAVTSACDVSRHVQVRCVASAGCSTDFILDVIGYYL